jgi:hypothetical protein
MSGFDDLSDDMFEDEDRSDRTAENPYGGAQGNPYGENPYGGSSYDGAGDSGTAENPYGGSQGNPYGENPYGQPYGPGPQYGPHGKKAGTGFGVASMVLGILSLALFCSCINLPLALLAIIFGIIQLVSYEKKGMAAAGIATAAISLVLFLVCYGMVFSNPAFTDMLQREMFGNDALQEFIEDYENDEDWDDDYPDDDRDIYFDEPSGGTEFLRWEHSDCSGIAASQHKSGAGKRFHRRFHRDR